MCEKLEDPTIDMCASQTTYFSEFKETEAQFLFWCQVNSIQFIIKWKGSIFTPVQGVQNPDTPAERHIKLDAMLKGGMETSTSGHDGVTRKWFTVLPEASRKFYKIDGKQQFLDIGQQAIQDPDPWKKRKKWSESYYSPSSQSGGNF